MNEIKAVFGVITDIQYADCDDGESWDKSRTRFYRNSLNLVDNAIGYFKDFENKHKILSFVIHLGDLIDAKAKRTELNSIESMNRVLNKLDQLEMPVLHIWGNHEMYNFLRSELISLPLNTAKLLNQAIATANYYVYDVSDNLTIICLDFYEFSVIGYENDPENSFYINSLELLRKYNKNENLNQEKGLPTEFQHYLAFNGGLYGEQLDWLKLQIEKCQSTGKKALICGHVPISINASNAMNLAFNHREMSDMLWSFDGTVVAYFCGHFHQGGYFKETRNNKTIHHVTFPAIIETLPSSNAYSLVKVYDTKIVIEQFSDNFNHIEISL